MIRVVLFAALLFAFAAPATANTVEINQMIDTTAQGNGTSPGYSVAPFTLAIGDTLIVNFSFLPGQALSIVNPSLIGMQASASDMFSSSPALITSQQQNSMSFIGLQGPAYAPSSKADHTDGAAILNIFYPSEFLDGASGTVTFTGIQFGITILSYSDNVTEREYSNIFLLQSGDSVSVVAVPEPASGLLLLAGLAPLGYAWRKRRRH